MSSSAAPPPMPPPAMAATGAGPAAAAGGFDSFSGLFAQQPATAESALEPSPTGVAVSWDPYMGEKAIRPRNYLQPFRSRPEGRTARVASLTTSTLWPVRPRTSSTQAPRRPGRRHRRHRWPRVGRFGPRCTAEHEVGAPRGAGQPQGRDRREAGSCCSGQGISARACLHGRCA